MAFAGTWTVNFVPAVGNKSVTGVIPSPATKTFALTGGTAFNIDGTFLAISSDAPADIVDLLDEDLISTDITFTGAATGWAYGSTTITAPSGKYGTLKMHVFLSGDKISGDAGQSANFNFTFSYTAPSDDKSSGCTAAYAPFALLLAAPLFFFRKRG